MDGWPAEVREAMQRISDEARPHNIAALRRIAAHVRSVGGRDAHGNSDQQYDRAADQLTLVEIQRATATRCLSGH